MGTIEYGVAFLPRGFRPAIKFKTDNHATERFNGIFQIDLSSNVLRLGYKAQVAHTFVFNEVYDAQYDMGTKLIVILTLKNKIAVHLYTQAESESESIISMMRCIIFRIPVHVPDMYKDKTFSKTIMAKRAGKKQTKNVHLKLFKSRPAITISNVDGGMPNYCVHLGRETSVKKMPGNGIELITPTKAFRLLFNTSGDQATWFSSLDVHADSIKGLLPGPGDVPPMDKVTFELPSYRKPVVAAPFKSAKAGPSAD